MPELHYSDDELGLNPGWDVDPESQQPLSKHIREEIRTNRILRRELNDVKQKQAVQERQLAFAKAGIPLDAKGELFAKAYEGESDPEKVREAYEAVFGKVEQGSETGGTPSGEEGPDEGTATAARIAASAQGGTTPADGGQVKFEEALLAARGDNKKIRELISAAGAGAGIKLPDID